MHDEPAEGASAEKPVTPGGARRGAHWWRRVWRGFVTGSKVSHRWLAVVLGLLLVAETTSGAILLYAPQIDHWADHAVYTPTSSRNPISLPQAAAVVARAHPKFDPDYVDLDTFGVYEVYGNPDYALAVDPGTGRILGSTRENAVLQFLENVHECGLTCKGEPGYIAALNDDMPGLGIPGLKKVTIGDFLLGVTGLLLLYLCVTGIVLWWPGIRRLGQSFTIRLGRGSYRRDRDLHRVIGMAAVPFLLVWGLTGAGFEFPFVADAAYAIQGQHAPASPTLSSRRSKGPDISFAQAERTALVVTGGGRVVGYSPPGKSPTSVYQIDIVKGLNDWAYDSGSQWNLAVSVDRHDAGRALLTYSNPAGTPAELFFDGWGSAWHYGYPLDPWLRVVVFLAGLSPLLLAVSGVSTWLLRRRRRGGARKKTGATIAGDPGDPLSPSSA